MFTSDFNLPPDHLLLDSASNLGPLKSRWEMKFENCWYKSVRILEVLKLLFQKLLNLSSSQRDIGGPILGALSNNRWLGVALLSFDYSALRLISLLFFISTEISGAVRVQGYPLHDSSRRDPAPSAEEDAVPHEMIADSALGPKSAEPLPFFVTRFTKFPIAEKEENPSTPSVRLSRLLKSSTYL